MGRKILQMIMNSSDSDETLASLQEYLTSINQQIEGNKIPLQKFIITKKLVKHPSEYNSGTHLPHVECAKRMISYNMPVKVGDFIEYLVVEGEGSEYERTYPIEYVLNKKLNIDKHWYKTHQIIPPTCRLLDPIQGISTSIVGACFGIEIKERHFNTNNNNAISSLDDLDLDEEDDFDVHEDYKVKYKNCTPIKLRCKYCDTTLLYEGVLHPQTRLCGFKCYTGGCKGYVNDVEEDIAYYKNQLTLILNSLITKYYTRTYKQVGNSNNNSTISDGNNDFSYKSEHAINLDTHQLYKESYSAKQLNTDFEYMMYLFDDKKADMEFKQYQLDKKIPKDQLQKVSHIYEKCNVDLKCLSEIRQHLNFTKQGSTYDTVDMKDLCSQFLTMGKK